MIDDIKKLAYQERDEEERTKFGEKLENIEKSKIVYVDEAGDEAEIKRI